MSYSPEVLGITFVVLIYVWGLYWLLRRGFRKGIKKAQDKEKE